MTNVLGGEGEGPGEFRRPSQLATDPSGAVHVWDRGLSRVTSFSPAGGLLATTLIKARGLTDFTMAGDTVWFVRPLTQPAYTVMGVLLRTGEIVDSFALLSDHDVRIAGFGSRGKVVTMPTGNVAYVGPRPVQFRVRGPRNTAVRGVDRFPKAEGIRLERGTRLSPVGIHGADANQRGEIAVLYSSNTLSKEGVRGDRSYVIEILNSAGKSLTRIELAVDAATALAWTREGQLLVGVVDEVPKVWRLKITHERP